jgi:hypothetical protein
MKRGYAVKHRGRDCAIITIDGVRHVVQRTPHGIYIDTAPVEHYADRVRLAAEAALQSALSIGGVP